ncbi:DUF3654 domain-containing protein [Encephalitozoon hellem]|uniref:DUF3654 domain-containing protein n=1 Tax=Encephalitozoon hellem TaxID=27973 RepID=A0ABY8CQA7_ENCHE|nr:DUF3654 domain-containing protein [Encephalitozoon hellem]WEL39551.1 DUF3654 domain-containing protein [Encephalitozoon hellem]WEL39759.1 DUF3654 domain-containing protein [Encephalitozoon hellem]
MRFGALQVLVLFGWMTCSTFRVESLGVFDLAENERPVLFPIIFYGSNAIVLPNTRFKDLEKGTSEEVHAKRFISCIPRMVLSFMFYDVYCKDDSRLERIFVREMGRYMERISEEALSVYAKGRKTFGELLLMVYDRLFECDVRDRNRRMTILGRRLIEEADKMMDDIGDDIDVEEREEREDFCSVIKERGEKCCNVERWRRIVRAESVVCDASASLYSKLPEEELLGLLAEGCTKKILKKKGLSEEELSEKGYLEHNIIDTGLFLDTYDKHGSEVVKEIVRQMMLGKDGREIDSKYVEKVVRVVDERRRRRELEASRHAAELLGEELSGKKSKGKAKGKKSKRKSDGKTDKKGPSVSREEERVDKESKGSESPDEELAGAVGGVSIEDHRPKRSDKRYRIHKRVSVWMRDASNIKRALDGGREEKWKGKSIEDIERQKITHDIIEVVRLLESCDADLFFMDARTSVKDGVERSRRVAVGVLEVSGERRVGVVEAVSFKDKDGQDVIYHLMFRETVAQEIGGVMSQGISPESEMAGDSSVECSGSEGVFEYAPGTRCEVSQDTHRFVVTWKNPRNTSEILKRLTVVCRPETI